MGNFNSQYFQGILDDAVSCESSSGSDNATTKKERSVYTPKCRTLDCDPRSPTEGIIRTPIQILSTSPALKTVPESEGQSTEYTPTPSITRNSKYSSWGKDPRSPALCNSFTRTPIQFADADDDLVYEDAEDTPSTVVTESKRMEDEGEEKNVQIVHVEEPEAEAVDSDLQQDLTHHADKEVVTQCTGTSHSSDVTTTKAASMKKETLNSSKNSCETPKSHGKMQLYSTNKENSSSHQKMSTPEQKTDNAVKPKVRTPLGTLCVTNSPLQILREKQSLRVNKIYPAGFAQSPQVVRTTDQHK